MKRWPLVLSMISLACAKGALPAATPSDVATSIEHSGEILAELDGC
jgi:hypothetical protein